MKTIISVYLAFSSPFPNWVESNIDCMLHCNRSPKMYVLDLSYVAPLTVHHVSHSMSLVWALLHHSLCIMCLTLCPWFELRRTAHCVSCVSEYVLGLSFVTPLTVHNVSHSMSLVLSYVAPLTVHHVSHSISLVWALLNHSLCIMCLKVCRWFELRRTPHCASCV